MDDSKEVERERHIEIYRDYIEKKDIFKKICWSILLYLKKCNNNRKCPLVESKSSSVKSHWKKNLQ